MHCRPSAIFNLHISAPATSPPNTIPLRKSWSSSSEQAICEIRSTMLFYSKRNLNPLNHTSALLGQLLLPTPTPTLTLVDAEIDADRRRGLLRSFFLVSLFLSILVSSFVIHLLLKDFFSFRSAFLYFFGSQNLIGRKWSFKQNQKLIFDCRFRFLIW